MNKIDSNSFNNININSIKNDDLLNKAEINQIALPVILNLTKPSINNRIKKITIVIIQVTFFPITLLVKIIINSISTITIPHGLGKKTRHIDEERRKQLKELGGETISFGLQGKSILEGMFFQNKNPNNPQKTVLICTGGHKSYEYYAIPMVRELQSMGHNVMVFNYEGFGKSEGNLSKQGIYDSVEAAYQYLLQEKKCQEESIVAWGYSLGSGAVTELATNHTKVDIIIDRGFSTFHQVAYDTAEQSMKILAKITFLASLNFNNINKLKKIKSRAFIMQATKDETMLPDNHGRKIKKAIASNKNMQYAEVEASHEHNDQKIWFSEGLAKDMVIDFLNQPAKE